MLALFVVIGLDALARLLAYRRYMMDRTALNAAISSLTTAVNAAVAKLANGGSPDDFTTEVNSINAATAALNAAVNPSAPVAVTVPGGQPTGNVGS